MGKCTSKGQQCCCQDSSDNEHDDGYIFLIAAPMAMPIYMSMIEDIIHISVEGHSDWTSGSLRKHAPKWQQCCCLDCSDSEHGDGHYSFTAKPMDKPFFGGVYGDIRYVSV